MNWRINHMPLSHEEIAGLHDIPEPEWDDEMTCPDGKCVGCRYERLSIDGDRFATVEQLEQAWIFLQTSFGVKSSLASDPEWGMSPEPTKLLVQ